MKRSDARSLALISASSFNWMAMVSRFRVCCSKNTIRNVMTDVAVLTTNCQVSDQPNTGPVTAQATIRRRAMTKVRACPAIFDAH
jgi:hypothetical protein